MNAAPKIARRRLEPEYRAQMILEEAVRFFAERGFSAQIAELAARLGISHGLIFRYFSTKQNLIDQVYAHVFDRHWSEGWATDLADRSLPLPDRIERFYRAYLAAVDNPQWIRIALHAGLAGEHLPRGLFVRRRTDDALSIMMREVRHWAGLPEPAPGEQADQERAFNLHSTFVYLLMRKYVLGRPPVMPMDEIVALTVRNFLAEFTQGEGARSRRTPAG